LSFSCARATNYQHPEWHIDFVVFVIRVVSFKKKLFWHFFNFANFIALLTKTKHQYTKRPRILNPLNELFNARKGGACKLHVRRPTTNLGKSIGIREGKNVEFILRPVLFEEIN
jgi:hypothetical protein